jgi:hypothetical protein
MVNAPTSDALHHRVDGVRNESMGLAMHAVRGFRIGRVDQAEDPAGRLVDPVAEIANAVPILGLEIREVRLGDVARLDPPSIT